MEDITEQLLIFTFFIAIGMIIGILFDFFRIFRKSFSTSDIVTNFEDVIFCIVSGSIILIFIFILNNGEIRSYIIFAILIGLFLYFKLFSGTIIKYLLRIILFFKKGLYKIFFIPIKKLKNKSIKLVKKIKNNKKRQNSINKNKIKYKKFKKTLK